MYIGGQAATAAYLRHVFVCTYVCARILEGYEDFAELFFARLMASLDVYL